MSGASKAAKQAKSIDAICSQGNMIRKQLWKTQECKFFLKGKCTRGSGCSFAHEEVKVAPDFTKTSLCEAFSNGNKCRLSAADCPFAHGVKDLRITPLFMKKDDDQQVPHNYGGNVSPGKLPPPAPPDSEMINFFNMAEIPAVPPPPELWMTMQYHEPAYAAVMPWLAQAPPPPPLADRADASDPEENIIRSQLWRTQECKFFMKGKCSRGSACTFAHGAAIKAPDFTKTSLCEAFCNGNTCRLSSADCPFAHGVKELRMTPLFMKKGDDQEAPEASDSDPSDSDSVALKFCSNAPGLSFPTMPEFLTQIQYDGSAHAKKMQWLASEVLPPPPPDSLPLPFASGKFMLAPDDSEGQAAKLLEERKAALAERLSQLQAEAEKTKAEMEELQAGCEENTAQIEVNQQMDIYADVCDLSRVDLTELTQEMAATSWLSKATAELHCLETPSEDLGRLAL